MAEEDKRTRRGGRFCVAGAPNKQSCRNTTYTEGIKMHQFPSDPVVRQQWVKFVQKHRVDFAEPINKYAALCSAHFEESCYSRKYAFQLEGMEGLKMNRVLIRGSIPTRDTVVPAVPQPCSSRTKRQLKRQALNDHPAKKRKATKTTINLPSTSADASLPPTFSSPSDDNSVQPIHGPINPLLLQTPDSNNEPCSNCLAKVQKHRSLQKGNRRLKRKITELKKNIQELKSRVAESELETGNETEEEHAAPAPPTTCDTESTTTDDTDAEEEQYAEWLYASMEETTEDSNVDDEEEDNCSKKNIRVDSDTPAHEEPKFIVYYGMLLNIFSLFCFNCKEAKPKVSMVCNGTMVTVNQDCQKCNDQFVWRSQPLINGRYPAGNLLLSFAVLVAGASISKVLLVFRHMGLSVYNLRTFFRHQRHFLFPTILHFWESYQDGIIMKLKGMKNVVWAGDGRFDSMGHSAKYGVYTMFCTTLMKICHFEVVQANETNGSQQTELEGCKRSFAFIKKMGLGIPVFISDRHRGIAKWIRENNKDTKHFFDIWHVARTLTKKLLQASKEKGFELIGSWIKAIRKHLYWCATSTKPGFQALIAAKWNSFMCHVANKHTDHPDPLYRSCKHGPLEPRKWIKPGTAAYDKLNMLLTRTGLVSDIKQLSCDAQTSCLEGFHATLNHWHPKMISFSWMGTICRHLLASLHFNENLNREMQTAKDGSSYVKISYPKYKLGEEVVRDVRVPPTYEYVDGLKKLLFSLPRLEMKEIFTRYTNMEPEPLTHQYPNRLNRDEAIKASLTKKQHRFNTPLFPTEKEQDQLQQLAVPRKNPAIDVSGKSRLCRTCKNPMRGHAKANCGKK